MKTLSLLLLVTFLCVKKTAANWESLNKLKDTLHGYQGAAETAIQTIQDVIRNTTSDAASFLSNLDGLSIVKEVNSLKKGDICKLQFLDLKTSKKVFKLHFSKLEGPLVKRMADIKNHFNSLKSSISVYQQTADSKLWVCKIAGNECLEETKIWLEERLLTLMCKIIKNCAKKSMVKREASPICGDDGYYEYEGDCYSINEITCDGQCDQFNCSDEPSNGCNKYCVGGFHCWNLQCIDSSKFCDGHDDCGDGSDERVCVRRVPLPNCTLEDRKFLCNDRSTCIDHKEVCNGVDDCRDGSDERGCLGKDLVEKCTLEEGKFLCGDRRKCLELRRTCDGLSDCADGSDEAEACQSGHCGAECRAAGGVCLRTPRGQICLSHCPPGTSETSSGCEARTALPPYALADLLDDLPRMTARYMSAYTFLQKRLMDELMASHARVTDCKGGTLGDLQRLTDYITSSRPPLSPTEPTVIDLRYTTEEMMVPELDGNQ